MKKSKVSPKQQLLRNFAFAVLLLQRSSFPRKSCYDSRFLHLHQFLSGNFLACSLIWTFTSQSGCSPPSSCPAWSSDAMFHFRLRSSSKHFVFSALVCFSAFQVLIYNLHFMTSQLFTEFIYMQSGTFSLFYEGSSLLK